MPVTSCVMLHMTTPQYYTLAAASLALQIPNSTLRSWRYKGAIGPWPIDASGREILTAEDLEQIRTYAEGRRRAQGLAPETP